MKVIKLLAIIMLFAFSQSSSAQLANFYSSPNYSSFINGMISNSIWKSSMERYTNQYKGSDSSRSYTPSQDIPEVIPEYRRYPAVQFKSTGTRLTLKAYLDSLHLTAKDKAELKQLVLKIFKDYEFASPAKTYKNDWALAYVSYVGLNNHVYYGNKGKPLLPFEQNIGLRDVVAEYATDNDLFKNKTDKEKQELYELMIMLSGLTYYFYEKACKENNLEEIEGCKLSAAQNLKLVRLQ